MLVPRARPSGEFAQVLLFDVSDARQEAAEQCSPGEFKVQAVPAFPGGFPVEGLLFGGGPVRGSSGGRGVGLDRNAHGLFQRLGAAAGPGRRCSSTAASRSRRSVRHGLAASRLISKASSSPNLARVARTAVRGAAGRPACIRGRAEPGRRGLNWRFMARFCLRMMCPVNTVCLNSVARKECAELPQWSEACPGRNGSCGR